MVIQIPNQKAVIDHYGVEAQIPVFMEECAELIKEISKAIRGQFRREFIAEDASKTIGCQTR